MLNLVGIRVNNTLLTGYEIGNEYYSSSALTHGAAPTAPILYRIPIDTSRLTSRLIRINTTIGGVMILK